MIEGMRRLSDVLLHAGDLDWKSTLYLPKNDRWHKATPCAVLDPEDTFDSDEEPSFAVDYGLTRALPVAAVQDVVTNAQQQKPDIDAAGLLQALLFYLDHDAFINLT